jgi:hypothetical protein
MKILVLVMLVTAVWVVLATVFGRCGGRPAWLRRARGVVLGGAGPQRSLYPRARAAVLPSTRPLRPAVFSAHRLKRGKIPGPLIALVCAGKAPGGPGGDAMKFLLIILSAMILVAPAGITSAADDSKVKAATQQVETGAKKIGDGQVGTGVEETAKGIGHTVAEGAKYTGEKFKESGKAAEPQAKSSWTSFKESANSFGHSVKNFFTNLFN